MTRKIGYERLVEIFRTLSADHPEGWAGSESREDIPQLARFLFLRAAWRGVVGDTDSNWIEEHRSRRGRPDAPLAATGPALDRLLAKGIDVQDLTDVVRAMQYHLLFRICYLLDDPDSARDDIRELIPEIDDVCWTLLECDRDGNLSGRSIGGLHESALETDPTGREMRPRKK